MAELKMRFIKPCRETDSSPKLTVRRVEENKRRKTETSLLLDLNILIRMEDVILRGKNPADLGLMELVNFVNQCPPETVCLSPGFALSEVHPKFKKQCFEIFEVFLSIFCPPVGGSSDGNEKLRIGAGSSQEITVSRAFYWRAIFTFNFLLLTYSNSYY